MFSTFQTTILRVCKFFKNKETQNFLVFRVEKIAKKYTMNNSFKQELIRCFALKFLILLLSQIGILLQTITFVHVLIDLFIEHHVPAVHENRFAFHFQIFVHRGLFQIQGSQTVLMFVFLVQKAIFKRPQV